MTNTILDEIIAVTRSRLSLLSDNDRENMKSCANTVRSSAEGFRFSKALSRKDRINLIAEIKRASPSKGVINDRIDVSETAQIYQRGGACAISVLTEETYFKGSINDLKTARATVNIPLLRKDFVVDEYQIHEAAAEGADAVLLIVAALSLQTLGRFYNVAIELGLDALIEVHSEEELDSASQIGAGLIGVNNRDLHTFEVSLETSRRLIKRREAGVLMVAESGISTRAEIEELRSLGFDGFLVGESLMRGESVSKIAELAA
jgi:indole-3-glycerol phosphate synthase